MNKQATHVTGRSSNATQTSATIVPNKEAKNRFSHLGKALVMSCFCLAVLAGLAMQPAFAIGTALRYAYVTDPVTASIFAFSITPATGVLVPLPGACAVTPSTGPAPIAAVVDNTGNFLYVANNLGASVSLYFITPGTGCLVPGPVFPLAPGGAGPVAVAITPHNHCLFVSDNLSGTVDSFVISPATGFLAPAAGSPFPAGPMPQGIAADPANESYLYVANNVAAGTITSFTWIPAGPGGPGCSLIPGPITPGLAAPWGVAIDPAGQFLAVTESGAGLLETYPILLGGGAALGPPNPPAPTGAGPLGVAVTPFGDMAFVANSGPATVSSYLLVPAGGAPLVNGPAKPSGLKPSAVTIDWTGTYFYVVDTGAGTVHGYKPNVTTGKPGLAFGHWAAGVGPTSMAIQP
jgi:DNA-binding beta-propeller fold protein YncE